MNLEKDGEYFALFKRLMELRYTDPSGMPGLQSHNLVRPHKRSIVISAGAKWDRFYVNRAVYIWTPDRRRIDFISGEHPGDLSGDPALPWNSSVSGFAKLYLPGEWHAKTPLIGADVEGTRTTLVMSDAALGIDAGNLGAADLIGQVASGNEVDLASIHGVAQTPLDLTGRYVPVTWAIASAPVAVGAAVVPVVGAEPTRRAYRVFNASAGGQIIAVGRDPALASVNTGLHYLLPGDGEVMGPLDCPTTQALYAYASGAGGSLIYTKGT